MDIDLFYTICYIWLGTAFVIHVLMFFVTAPFGRHTSSNWGPMVNNKLAWVLMELPSPAIMIFFLTTGTYSTSTFAWVLFLCWILHYTNRTFIYPLRIKPTDKQMPLVILLFAVIFNLVNAGLNGYYLAELAGAEYGIDWLWHPVTLLGGFVFFSGMMINWKADHILINLRKPGEKGYKIPRGFLFDYISSPNLFGEILEWTGFAIMAWNLPALTFAVWTYANLVPRAKNHHDWYRRKFANYPEHRKAVFPFLF